MGNYSHLESGFPQNTLRAMTNAPVFTQYIGQIGKANNGEWAYEQFKAAKALGYIVTLGTSDTNSFGLRTGSSFQVLTLFEMDYYD
jgi:hypothetical protein